MPLRTKRWNDPVEEADGHRLLICRYRPRGVRREDETWDAWCKDLAPSVELHADYYGKRGEPISFAELKRRFLIEIKAHQSTIEQLGERVRAGETITLFCSSACLDPAKCHRSIVRDLIERAATGGTGQGSGLRHR